jgi:hypothetical protein
MTLVFYWTRLECYRGYQTKNADTFSTQLLANFVMCTENPFSVILGNPARAEIQGMAPKQSLKIR